MARVFADMQTDSLDNNDRIILLRPKEGMTASSSTGLVDGRLFTGENRLHAIMDVGTCLWSMRYDAGAVPQPLKQKFTSFNKLYKHAEDYFNKRNIEIKEKLTE